VIDRLHLLNAGQRTDQRQFSDELQLLGTSFDKKLTWIVGGFYSDTEPNGPQGSFFDQFEAFTSTPTPIGIVSLAVPAGSVIHTTTKDRAVYGQIGLDVSQWTIKGLKVNLGYRYTWDDISLCGGNVAAPGATTTNQVPFSNLAECKVLGAVSATDGFGELKTQTNAPTWTVGLDYQITPDVFTYFTYRRGYRSGGINSPVFATPCTTGGACVGGPGTDLSKFQFVAPEKVTDYEVGLKTQWELGQVRGLFNVDAFRMEYNNAVQFINTAGIVPTSDSANPNNGSFGLNAADLTIQGVEVEAHVSPIRSLTFSVTGSYIDQTVDKIHSVPAPFTLTARQVTLPTPDLSATAGFRWTLPVDAWKGDLVLSGDYFWTDSWQVQGNPVPGYSLTNFRLDWENIADAGVTASLYVTNAFDHAYILSGVVNLAGFPWDAGMYGPPRMYGLELRYKFGG
jgi:iron complex outermembrane recepter protein